MNMTNNKCAGVKEFVNPLTSTQCFHFLSLPTEYMSGWASSPDFLNYLTSSLLERIFRTNAMPKVTTRDMQLLNFFHPGNTHHPHGFQYFNFNQTFRELQRSVEYELLECGKSAYISSMDIIKTEHNFLAKYYPSKRFYKGKGTFD